MECVANPRTFITSEERSIGVYRPSWLICLGGSTVSWRDHNDNSQDNRINILASRQISVEMDADLWAAVEAWREANLEPNLEAAIVNLVRRALQDEVAEIQDLIKQARARMGLDGGE